LPLRHLSHLPHPTPGLTTTSVPFRTSFSCAGTSSTTPATSHPEMWGRDGLEYGGPILPQISRWFRAHAFTLTRASPGFLGTGSGASSYCSTSGPPWRWNLTAFTRLPDPPLPYTRCAVIPPRGCR